MPLHEDSEALRRKTATQSNRAQHESGTQASILFSHFLYHPQSSLAAPSLLSLLSPSLYMGFEAGKGLLCAWECGFVLALDFSCCYTCFNVVAQFL